MSSTRYASFRSFLTERFTAVAVEVFEEVGNIIEEYYEENKRLRSIIQMTLDPVVKLRKIGLSLLLTKHFISVWPKGAWEIVSVKEMDTMLI